MKKVINLTPHSINLLIGGKLKEIKSEGVVRVSQSIAPAGEIDTNLGKVTLTNNTYGEVVGLPQKSDDTIIIVSGLVANACKDRDDLAIVNETIRNDKGQIIGCKSLCLINQK